MIEVPTLLVNNSTGATVTNQIVATGNDAVGVLTENVNRLILIVEAIVRKLEQ
jgi:hypothetical protein